MPQARRLPQNWRGRPLTDRIAVVELIGATTTKAGLKVACALDTRTYQKNIKLKDAEIATLDCADLDGSRIRIKNLLDRLFHAEDCRYCACNPVL